MVDQLVGGSGAGAGNNRTIQVARCDPYFESHNVTLIPGIRGLASGVFLGKIWHSSNAYMLIDSPV